MLLELTQSSAGVTLASHSPTLAGTHILPLKLSGKTNSTKLLSNVAARQETVWQLLEGLHTELPHNPAISPTATQKLAHGCSQQHCL